VINQIEGCKFVGPLGRGVRLGENRRERFRGEGIEGAA
jgi:hypothetical protein